MLITCNAAAQDTGLPPKVLACAPPSQSIMSDLPTVAPIGIPDARAFDVLSMSGSTPQCSIANHRPVRPIPDSPRLLQEVCCFDQGSSSVSGSIPLEGQRSLPRLG